MRAAIDESSTETTSSLRLPRPSPTQFHGVHRDGHRLSVTQPALLINVPFLTCTHGAI